MAHDETRKAEAMALLGEGLSIRQTARTLGLSPATVKAWKDAAEEGQASASEGPAGPVENETSELLLRKAQALLRDIEKLPPKDQAHRASAVDKLLSKYLSLMGEPEKTVVEKSDDSATAAIVEMLLRPQPTPAVVP